MRQARAGFYFAVKKTYLIPTLFRRAAGCDCAGSGEQALHQRFPQARVLSYDDIPLALSSVSTVFAAIPQKIRIGTDPTYAPFESKNAQG
ncbi:hypothetical protein AB0098_27845, partial [Klebsiella pneumoniae]